MKNTKPIRSIISLSKKTRNLSVKGVKYVRETPMHKLAAGTALMFIPGGLTTLTIYNLSKRVASSYGKFKENENNKHINFIQWVGKKSHCVVKRKYHSLRKNKLTSPEKEVNTCSNEL